MQFAGLGDVPQHHGPHGFGALFKEFLLGRHNRLRDPKNGVRALLNVLHHPSGFLKLLLQAAVAPVVLDELGVL